MFSKKKPEFEYADQDGLDTTKAAMDILLNKRDENTDDAKRMERVKEEQKQQDDDNAIPSAMKQDADDKFAALAQARAKKKLGL